MNNTLNSVGLNTEACQDMSVNLNQLLSTYQVFYMNTRGYHWNIKGKAFFELHLKFEEIYTNLLLKVDEIAERVLTLGYTPLHSFSDFLAHSLILETKNVMDADSCVKNLVDGFSSLLVAQRKILSLSNSIEDDGTASLMSDYIREQEKLLWMFNAYLK